MSSKQKDYPCFKELAVIDEFSTKFSNVRDIFGEKLDAFMDFASRIKEQREPAERVWRELPSWMKKILAGNSSARAVGRPAATLAR